MDSISDGIACKVGSVYRVVRIRGINSEDVEFRRISDFIFVVKKP